MNIWSEMFYELINCRWLIWRLFIRDFIAKYKQTVFGFLWAPVMPLFIVGAFIFLSKARVINIGATDVPYPVFALVGITIWQLFATGLSSCTNSIVQGGGTIIRINFPKEVLVVTAFAQAVFDFIVRLGFLVVVFTIYKVTPSPMMLLLPVVVIPLILFTLGLGLLFSFLNVVVRDTENIVILMTTFLLFLTPVLYPAPHSGIFSCLAFINPLNGLIGGIRDMVILGSMKEPFQFFFSSFISLLVFLLSWRIFHLVELRIAERV